jgi:hypothetical protein
MLRIRRLAAALVILAALVYCGGNWYIQCQLSLPPYEKTEVVWTDQNWKPDVWNWFYHASQGGALESVIPYSWFLSFEQPGLSVLARPLLVEPDYIQRFGFLSSPKGQYNPDGLPAGFARTRPYDNPIDGRVDDVIGFTCAACHTGQLHFKGKALRIEGGPAMTNLQKFRVALAISLLLTRYDPLSFSRFAGRVLGPQADGRRAPS